MVDLSIIVINFNTRDLTVKCLESVFKYTSGIKFEVIVIDNNSDDGSVLTINRIFKNKVKIIKNKENLGFGKANNQGMQIAEGRYVCLLNSDTLLIGNLFDKVIEWFEGQALVDVGSKVGMVGVKLLNPDRSEQESFGSFPTLLRVARTVFLGHFLPVHLPDETRKVDWVKGACMILKKEVFETVGGFDENIFMYVEETEWCYRVRKAGYQIVYWPQAAIIHYGGASSKAGNRAIFGHIFNGYRYFYKKHLPPWQLGFLDLILRLKANAMILAGRLLGRKDYVETYREVLRVISIKV